MEKKGNRNTPNSSRGSSGTDLKKSQDVATGKQWPRGVSRRREPPSGFAKANEPSRKPQPHRNVKTFDKRPKPRGSYYTGAVSRNEETSLEEFEEPELGSVFSPGSKKQSLNHLLNFSFAPRESYQGGYQPERNGANKGGKWLVTKKHKYNKEHFLQANCQFIVNEKGDYKQYMNNPDALVNWDLIEQVNVLVNEQPSCPICLYPPVAAKMTKCGHIYCWSCILHYLALSDKQWRKCPICFDAIKKEDLKSVIAIPHKTFNVNDTITFKLMKRQRGSLTAYPADAKVDLEVNKFDKNKKNCYSKLLLANIDNILEILDRENTELIVQMAEDENCPERCFMEEAVQFLNERRDGALKNVSNIKVSNKNLNVASPDIKTLEDLEILSDKNDNTLRSDSNDADVKNEDKFDVEFSLTEAECGSQINKFHYFYQVADGQHIYLHAINAKMLEHTYGSLEFGPKTLTGRILEKEGGSMTEDLRKKLRYLQHMPVTCQFEVAEIKLYEPIVSKITLEHFKEQIEMRRKRRQRRAKEEKKREKRIEAEEDRKIGKYASPNLHLDSKALFPDVKEAHDMFPEFLDHRQRTESESTYQTPSDRSTSPDLSSSMSSMSLESGYATGPSFASMLAAEKKPLWPSLKASQPTRQSSSSSINLINVTGSKLTSSTVRKAHRQDDSDNESMDYDPVPDFNRSFGDALAQALARSVEDNGDNDSNDSVTSGKKKKKKNKQKLLFSTHMAFPAN